MAYGGSFLLGWNQSPSDWREWQYQCYQESLEEDCKFCKGEVCTALACYDSSTRCGCRNKDGYLNYE